MGFGQIVPAAARVLLELVLESRCELPHDSAAPARAAIATPRRRLLTRAAVQHGSVRSRHCDGIPAPSARTAIAITTASAASVALETREARRRPNASHRPVENAQNARISQPAVHAEAAGEPRRPPLACAIDHWVPQSAAEKLKALPTMAGRSGSRPAMKARAQSWPHARQRERHETACESEAGESNVRPAVGTERDSLQQARRPESHAKRQSVARNPDGRARRASRSTTRTAAGRQP